MQSKNDDNQDIYMDMTPKSSPYNAKGSRKLLSKQEVMSHHATSRGYKSQDQFVTSHNKLPVTDNQTGNVFSDSDTEDYVDIVSMSVKSPANVKHVAQSNDFSTAENVYADMTKSSPMRSSIRSETTKQVHSQNHSLSIKCPNYVENDGPRTSSHSEVIGESPLRSPLQVDTSENSPKYQVQASWFSTKQRPTNLQLSRDDEDDDYADVSTLPSKSSEKKHSMQKAHAAAFSPFKGRAEQAPSSPLYSLPKRDDANERVKSKTIILDHSVRANNFANKEFRKRSGGISVSSIDSYLSENQTNLTFDSCKSPSTAGVAAKKYLQSPKTITSNSGYEINHTSSPGVMRSTSRAGKSGGVQTRIDRNRQHTSLKNIQSELSISLHELDLNSDANHSLKLIRASSVGAVNASRISAVKQKNATFNQRTQTSIYENEEEEDEHHYIRSTELQRESFEKKVGKGLDGSNMMKFIANGNGSSSLDRKYLEWLSKTSAFASRNSPTTTSTAYSFEQFALSVGSNDIEEVSRQQAKDDPQRKCKEPKATKLSGGTLTLPKSTNAYNDHKHQELTPAKSSKKDKKGKLRRVKTMITKNKSDVTSNENEVKTASKTNSLRRGSAENCGSDKSDTLPAKHTKSHKIKHSKSWKFKNDQKKNLYDISLSRSEQNLKSPTEAKQSSSESASCWGKPPLSASSKKSSLSSPNISPSSVSSTTEFSKYSFMKVPEANASTTKLEHNSNSLSSAAKQPISRHTFNSVSSCNDLEESSTGCNDYNSENSDSDSDNAEENIFSEASYQKISTRKSKASTLGRIFKVRPKRGLDVFDSSAKKDSLDIVTNVDKDLYFESDYSTTAEQFMKVANLIHGFIIMENETKHDSPELPVVPANVFFGNASKYATITGMYDRRNATERKSVTKFFQLHNFDEKNTLSMDMKANQAGYKNHKRAKSGTLARLTTNSKEPLSFHQITTANTSAILSTPLRQRVKQKYQPLYKEPSARVLAIARILYQYINFTHPGLIRDHNAQEEKLANDVFKDHDDDVFNETVYRRCTTGYELITWLQEYSQNLHLAIGEKRDSMIERSSTQQRFHLTGMWQVLLEEGAIKHVRNEEQFEDSNYLYYFSDEVVTNDEICQDPIVASPRSLLSPKSSIDSTASPFSTESSIGDDTSITSRSSSMTSNTKLGSPNSISEWDISEATQYLDKQAPDALFRKALRKLPHNRTQEELLMIYEEILNIKALCRLSDSVKRELSRVLQFEFHQEVGTTLFNQGDEGRSWYIIFRGSVNVSIMGKGVVCNLREGDDFGDLALINETPRAASIVLAEKDCQFLKVEKFDFVRILKDVEENTVRLKEHGDDVLILQKLCVPSTTRTHSHGSMKHLRNHVPVLSVTPTRQSHCYSISAGAPEKILEHILKSLKPWNIDHNEEALEDFILMHVVFMKTDRLCEFLLKNYQSEDGYVEFEKSMKRKVVYFVVRWSHLYKYLFTEDKAIVEFLKELREEIMFDVAENSTYAELQSDLNNLYAGDDREDSNKCLLNISECVIRYRTNGKSVDAILPIRKTDEVILKIHNLEKTYTTVKLPVFSNADDIVTAVAEKLNKPQKNLILLELQEDGDCYQVPRNRYSIATSVKINSRLYLCDEEEKAKLNKVERWISPIPDSHIDMISSLEIAYHLTRHDWELVNNVHVMEFVYKIFGAYKFHQMTPNLDILTRRFNQLAYWAPTEICSCSALNKRVQLLRKFVKIAQHLKMYQNMNAFMAVMIGIGNQAVSRLYNTWDKLPAKYKKLVQEYETILNPSRNHRSYRLLMGSMKSPIPYLPLLLKDMTFMHEGNDTVKTNLVNFEKMHMLCNSVRSVVRGSRKAIEIDNILTSTKTSAETKTYVRTMAVITDQKILNDMSNKLEPKR